MSQSVYGGEALVYTIDTSAFKMCCTPDGGKYFDNCDSLLSYISDKCGRDVVDCFKSQGDILVTLDFDYINAFERLCNFKESLEKGKLKSPIVRKKAVQRILEDYQDLLAVYDKVYDMFC